MPEIADDYLAYVYIRDTASDNAYTCTNASIKRLASFPLEVSESTLRRMRAFRGREVTVSRIPFNGQELEDLWDRWLADDY